ncbi:MAG: NAD(P)H-dependent oxidoreductase [Taibaiella sp.]|nr:NAD(P)H-dependent oxidoreductase [Taibaiella sp.]
MKITAFAGSNSSTSINKQLVRFACSYLNGYEIDLLDLNDYEMPLFSVDREAANGYPGEAYTFLEKLANADALVVSLAENNRTYSVAFKNIFDWISRIEKKPFFDKPMLLMSTSPGGYGGGNVMETAKKFLPQFGTEIIETFSLPKFQENFGQGRGIIHPEYKRELEEKVESFKNAISP